MIRRARALWGAVALMALGLLAACTAAPELRLEDLTLRDSTYLHPETLEPFTGDVVKFFDDDSTTVQLRGSLRDGTWHGELIVYHPNGRIRYMGSFAGGQRCGVWTENADPDPPGSVFQQLKQEIEAMGLYPPCDSLEAGR